MLFKRLLLCATMLLPSAITPLFAIEAVEVPSACDCSECNTCDDCCSEAWAKPILSWLAPSDRCYYDFISPMTNPVFFEDPRPSPKRGLFLRNTDYRWRSVATAFE